MLSAVLLGSSGVHSERSEQSLPLCSLSAVAHSHCLDGSRPYLLEPVAAAGYRLLRAVLWVGPILSGG